MAALFLSTSSGALPLLRNVSAACSRSAVRVIRRSKHEWRVPVSASWDFAPSVDPGETYSSERPVRRVTPEHWDYLNKVIWPPNCKDAETGESKKAELFHCREDIKYSWRKMWIVCEFVRGMAVDDAINQLKMVPRKGAHIMAEELEECKKMAYEKNIEFPSNMWIAEAFSTQARVVKGYRRHKGSQMGVVKYRFCNLFLRLEEGEPPLHITRDPPATGYSLMRDQIQYLRDRRIYDSL